MEIDTLHLHVATSHNSSLVRLYSTIRVFLDFENMTRLDYILLFQALQLLDNFKGPILLQDIPFGSSRLHPLVFVGPFESFAKCFRLVVDAFERETDRFEVLAQDVIHAGIRVLIRNSSRLSTLTLRMFWRYKDRWRRRCC